jgi:glucose-1-phosphate thymidylyltransferase
LILKPPDDSFRYGWAIALWKPTFTEFLHDYVKEHRRTADSVPELTAGHAIRASMKAGLRAESVVLGEDPYLDVGTPDDLAKAIQMGINGLL